MIFKLKHNVSTSCAKETMDFVDVAVGFRFLMVALLEQRLNVQYSSNVQYTSAVANGILVLTVSITVVNMFTCFCIVSA